MMEYSAALDQALGIRRTPIQTKRHRGGARAANPWWLSMPPGSYPFDQFNAGLINLPAQAAEITVVTFMVPQGMKGVIQRIANQLIAGGWVEGTGDFVWRIEADGIAIRNYNNILSSLGSCAQPGDRRKSPLLIFEHQTISLIGRNVAVAPSNSNLVGLLGGYFCPLDQGEDDAWF